MAPGKRRAHSAALDPPAGYRYVVDLIGPIEEAALIRQVAALPFEEFMFRGVAARRRVVHMGYRYEFESRGLRPGLAIPPTILEVRDRAAPLADRPPERFEEVLVTEYRRGATIGWHRDAPAFGSTVLGVSLASACRMRFRRRVGDAWETWEQTLEPRSAYVLSGAARSAWQHSIPPAPDLRYSITYRTIRHRPHPESSRLVDGEEAGDGTPPPPRSAASGR